MGMAVHISRGLLDRLTADTRAGGHAERCGLLFGSDERIDAFEPGANVHPSPETHFELDPTILIDAERAMRNGGPTLVGHYHSHPVSSAEPSPTDAAAALVDGRLWMIVGAHDCALWRFLGEGAGEVNGFVRVPLLVSDGDAS